MLNRTSHPGFNQLVNFLARVPAFVPDTGVSQGFETAVEEGGWRLRFSFDIGHDLAWRAVQELGCVLNQTTTGDRPLTAFMPVSPPPNLHGGPEHCLQWMIECRGEMTPEAVAALLESRLPTPVEDEAAWYGEPDDDHVTDGDERTLN